MQLPLVPTPWPFRAASSSGAVCFSRSYPRLLPPLLMLLAVWALVRVPIPTTQVVERKWGFPPSRSASTDSVERPPNLFCRDFLLAASAERILAGLVLSWDFCRDYIDLFCPLQSMSCRAATAERILAWRWVGLNLLRRYRGIR